MSSPPPQVSVRESPALSPAPAYSRALNRYARLWSVATVILLCAGGLVTSEKAGLSIPDWPLAYHRLIPPFVGNIRFEYTHRVIAGCIVLMTVAMLVWLWRAETRKWLRWFGVVALGTVVVQAILGGLTVLNFQPPWLSAAHASMAQLFFLVTVCVAVFTSRRWLAPARPVGDASPGVFALGAATTAAIYAQLIVGAGYRHGALTIAPHLVGACVVTILALTTVVVALSRHGHVPAVARPAKLLLAMLILQLALGWMAYSIKTATEHALQPPENRVVATVIHLVFGALLMATALLLTLRAKKHLAGARVLAAGGGGEATA